MANKPDSVHPLRGSDHSSERSTRDFCALIGRIRHGPRLLSPI